MGNTLKRSKRQGQLKNAQQGGAAARDTAPQRRAGTAAHVEQAHADAVDSAHALRAAAMQSNHAAVCIGNVRGTLGDVLLMLLQRKDNPFIKVELTLLLTLLCIPSVQQALRQADLSAALRDFDRRFQSYTVRQLTQELRTVMLHSAWVQPDHAAARAPSGDGSNVSYGPSQERTAVTTLQVSPAGGRRPTQQLQGATATAAPATSAAVYALPPPPPYMSTSHT